MLGGTGAAGVGLLLDQSDAGAKVARPGKKSPPSPLTQLLKSKPDPLIDAHVHLSLDGQNSGWFPFLHDGADYFSYLKEVGVDHILAFPSGQGSLAEIHAKMIDTWKKNPTLITPSMRVDPHNVSDSVAEIKNCREQGVVWICEQTAYSGKFKYSAAEFDAILHAAADAHMIINVHLLEEEEKPFEQYFERYPTLTFVLAHLWDNRKLVMGKAELVARHPNVMVDLSGYGVDRLGIWEHVIKTAGADKVLWGSDYPINDPAVYVARLNNARISSVDKQKVRHGNFTRLLAKHGT